MKLSQSVATVIVGLAISLLAVSPPTARAAFQSAQASVHAVNGSASCCIGGVWQVLKPNSTLLAGTTLKTDAYSTLDLLLLESGTVLRLLPGSELRFDVLDQMPAGEARMTTTRLTLLAGGLLGSQRKLVGGSQFEIRTPNGTARIVGTEYLVRADGAVTVLSGEVSLHFNLPGNGGSVKATVEAGFSFDPATGKVVPTTSAYLQNIIADVTAVKDNARTFKIGRATLVVDHTEDDDITPTHGHHHHHGDHDDGGDDEGGGDQNGGSDHGGGGGHGGGN
jgi:hypothetical protein